MAEHPIYVTSPLLPALEEYLPYLEKIWATKTLTNGGPMHIELERALCSYLGVDYISLFTNGTVALITALQALEISGEVITTSYSFVATAHSLLWNGLTPVFVDIDPDSFNLDPSKIEAAITPRTTAIMPVHCYGGPCDVDAIQAIADKHDLKVIYDAAHAFGVSRKGDTILKHGDLSILSFHATKVFNTFEGGAIICPDAKTKTKIDRLKNFGFVNEISVVDFGINGKMSEINAAFGLLQLKHIDQAIAQRRQIDDHYRHMLQGVKGLHCPAQSEDVTQNHSYFPILVRDDFPASRDEVYERLKQNNIFARRYFYPLISAFQMYSHLESSAVSNLAVANKIANQVLCLPIYPGLSTSTVEEIAAIIKGF